MKILESTSIGKQNQNLDILGYLKLPTRTLLEKMTYGHPNHI